MASCSSPTQYARWQRLKELAGYVDLIELEIAGPWPQHDLLRAVLRLCELLVPMCGPDNGELAALRLRMGALRLKLDHGFATEDTGEVEVPR